MTLVKRVNHPFFSTLDNLFGDEIERFINHDSRRNLPAVNVKETDKEFCIDLVSPGRRKEDFKIKLDDNVLTVSAESIESAQETDGEKVLRREYNHKTFSRSFTLPEGVNNDEITAKYEDGFLKITIPKKETIKKENKEITIL